MSDETTAPGRKANASADGATAFIEKVRANEGAADAPGKPAAQRKPDAEEAHRRERVLPAWTKLVREMAALHGEMVAERKAMSEERRAMTGERRAVAEERAQMSRERAARARMREEEEKAFEGQEEARRTNERRMEAERAALEQTGDAICEAVRTEAWRASGEAATKIAQAHEDRMVGAVERATARAEEAIKKHAAAATAKAYESIKALLVAAREAGQEERDALTLTRKEAKEEREKAAREMRGLSRRRWVDLVLTAVLSAALVALVLLWALGLVTV